MMMLRVQTERMHDAYFPSTREYASLWGLDRRPVRPLCPSAPS